MEEKLIRKLKEKSFKIKKDILKLAAFAGEGHCTPAMSIADILAVLYFHRLNIDPKDPNNSNRDRFILSKGHACLALYATLYNAGFFNKEKLYTFLKPGTGLAGHPIRGGAPGIEVSTGSLGHGISIGIGLALASKLDKKEFNIFILIGDGESNEGVVWEAALAASHYKLNNLLVIVDRNKYQCDGSSDNVMKMDPVDKKWESFGWEVLSCNGHDIAGLVEAINKFPFSDKKPSLIVANTVKGKGVNFMESNAKWHYRAPNDRELKEALSCLERSYSY